MPDWQGKRAITIVTACMRSDGLPDFALTEVEVTQDEFENGVHYALAEERLSDRGYEEPYVHFEELEAPSFLLPVVREYLTCKAPEPEFQETR